MYLDQIQAKKNNTKAYETTCGWVMSSLPVLGFIIFGLIPMALALYMAFCQMHYYDLSTISWVGFTNFEEVLADSGFWDSCANTLIYTISLPICLAISLCVSFLLTKKIKGKKAFRTIFFIPYVCSIVAVAVMWKWIFNPHYGLINGLFGLDKEVYNWFDKAELFRVIIIVISVWGGCGYSIILYSAALTNINPTLYEAAKIDGANSFQCFRHVTLPGVSPTTFYLFITGLIGSLQAFTTQHMLNSNGGPDGTGITIGFYLYREAFDYRNVGLGSAASLILSVFIIIITIIQFKVSKRWVSYD